MSAANPNPMEKSMVSVLVVANAGGGSPLGCSRKRGAIGRGNDGPEMILCGGNTGRKMEKDGRGRVEESREPGTAAPVQTGHLDHMTHS
jgi:hypothetical protein